MLDFAPSWIQPHMLQRQLGRYPRHTPNPLRSVYTDEHYKWEYGKYYRPLAVLQDGAYVAWGGEDKLLAGRRSLKSLYKRLVKTIFHKMKIDGDDVLDNVVRFLGPPEVYTKWTLKAMRNGMYDDPFVDEDEGTDYGTPQADHLKNCLELIEPVKEFSLICDKYVCVAQMAQDTVRARNSNQLYSYGLPKDETCIDEVSNVGENNSAQFNWGYGLYASVESCGGITFTHREDFFIKEPNREMNHLWSMELLVLPKTVSMLDFQEMELVNDRLRQAATHRVLAFEGTELHLTAHEVQNSIFVFAVPIRFRLEDTGTFGVEEQNREFDQDRQAVHDFVVQHIWTVELVTPLHVPRADFRPV